MKRFNFTFTNLEKFRETVQLAIVRGLNGFIKICHPTQQKHLLPACQTKQSKTKLC